MNAIAMVAETQIRGSQAPEPVWNNGRSSVAIEEPPHVIPVAPVAEKVPAAEEVKQAAEGINAFLKANGTHIQFALHDGTKRMIVEVKDDRTGEVIRTIPSKELLDLSARIGDMVGMLVDKKG